MTSAVSQRDYARCVADGACAKLKGVDETAANLPVVGVNWRDATAYAAWLSRQTGEDWRLPSDVEWAYAAGGRFHDDAIPESDGDSYVKQWLAKFDQEAARETQAEAAAAVRPFRRQCTRSRRSLWQCLGVDGHLLRAAISRRDGRAERSADPQLPGAGR